MPARRGEVAPVRASGTPRRVLLAMGTRPEATKMAPVYLSLRERSDLTPVVFLTGQHREQMQHGMKVFGMTADANLDVMVDRQQLPELAARIIPAAAEQLRALDPDFVLVHGDTLTTFVMAWTAFVEGIPVGHVEAGLRTGRIREPFPEEMNRRLTDTLTDLDLPPTPLSRDTLVREGKDPEHIVITGQTAVDAVLHASRVGTLPDGVGTGPFVTITMHRQENWAIMGDLARSLARVARAHPEITFVYPMHLNPAVRDAVRPALSSIANVALIEPLEYGRMAALMKRSVLLITDSGGLQEEGAALGVPVVVLRNVTERPEGVATGIVLLAGTDPARAERLINDLLGDPVRLQRMAAAPNPYGDGKAGERIARAVAWQLGLGPRPSDWVPNIPTATFARRTGTA